MNPTYCLYVEHFNLNYKTSSKDACIEMEEYEKQDRQMTLF